MVYPPAWEIIHSLKLVDYLRAQADKTWYSYIGVGRFRILGGQGGEAKSHQAHDVVTMSYWRRCDVMTSHRRHFRRHVPTRFLINQCQIITFLILKIDNIEIQELN